MNYDIVIVGGGPSGGAVASSVKMLHSDKSVLVIRKEPESLIPCGIPYTFGTLNSVEENIKPITPIKKAGVDFIFDEVTTIHANSKLLELKNNVEVMYDKLIIATGSTPFIPPIPGADLDGVVTIKKDLEYIKSINKDLKEANNVVVVGAGFIGVEMSDELANTCENVTLIESMDSILPLAFDKEIAEPAEEILRNSGVAIKTNTLVSEIIGEKGKVSGVKLNNGEIIKADKVVLSIGYRPNVDLAKDCGIETGIYDGIITDEYFRTNIEDVYAIGDCAEHRDFFTRKPSRQMLASTGSSEARIAGMNLYDLRVVKQTKGSIAIFSTSMDGISMGAAGLTEKSAKAEGFNIVVAQNEVVDRHPKVLPDSSKQIVKLIFSRGSGVILGAQITGGVSTGEMINILGLAIQKHMTASELAIMQFGTHPKLTAGPVVYPIVQAAMKAIAQMDIRN